MEGENKKTINDIVCKLNKREEDFFYKITTPGFVRRFCRNKMFLAGLHPTPPWKKRRGIV